MFNRQKSVSGIKDNPSKGQVSNKSDGNTKPQRQDRWHKEMLSRLLKKSKAIELAREQIAELIEKKNVLESAVRTKNEEIGKLNDKVLLLTRELASVKMDHLQALEDIKILKAKVQEDARKNEINEQRKILHDKMRTELDKSEKIIVRERLKNQSLERLNYTQLRKKWSEQPCSDPHYYEILRKKNILQKELQKKLDTLQAKEAQLAKRDILVNKLRAMLKRRPFDLIEDPNEQMLQYYRLIKTQKDKIKSLAGQVNMYETILRNEYSKLKTSTGQKLSKLKC